MTRLPDTSRIWNFDAEFAAFSRKIEIARERLSIFTEQQPQGASVESEVLEDLHLTVEELMVTQEELRQQNEELFQSRLEVEAAHRRYVDLFDFAPDGYLVTDTEGVIWEANRAVLRLFGMERSQLIGKPLAVYIEPGTVKEGFLARLTSLQEQESRMEWETHLAPRSQTPFPAQLSVQMTQGPRGKEIRWLVRDITPQKQAEAELYEFSRMLEIERATLEERVEARTAELRLEVAERTRAEAHIGQLNRNLQRAMTETHHRVKNNLQMISALIEIRTEGATSGAESLRLTLEHLSLHIRTLASLHEALTYQASQNGSTDTVSARFVLDALVVLVKKMTDGVTVETAMEDVLLPTAQVTAIAVIANELALNAIKHGGRVLKVSLSAAGGQAVLQVTDDGPGFPPNFDPAANANVGLDLVNTMTRHDLAGEASYENPESGGACVRVRFPLPAAASSAV